MPVAPQTGFPSIQTIMDLARSLVNDMFPGVGGQNGRILTNDAPFTLSYLNSAFRTLQRKLRNEGVTFPIKDNFILTNLTPVVAVDPGVQVFVSFAGYNDGTNMHATPQLPSDCMQPYELWEQTVGSGLQYTLMTQAQEGLMSSFQGPWMGTWEWRNYAIYMVGSTLAKNIRLRYLSGQPPLTAIPANFATTNVNILDCEDAIARLIAVQYGTARGADPNVVKALEDGAADVISDMAEEYVRRAQTVNYNRPPYGNGNQRGPLAGPGWGA